MSTLIKNLALKRLNIFTIDQLFCCWLKCKFCSQFLVVPAFQPMLIGLNRWRGGLPI